MYYFGLLRRMRLCSTVVFPRGDLLLQLIIIVVVLIKGDMRSSLIVITGRGVLHRLRWGCLSAASTTAAAAAAPLRQRVAVVCTVMLQPYTTLATRTFFRAADLENTAYQLIGWEMRL